MDDGLFANILHQAELCSYLQPLIKDSGSKVKVETVFWAPPSLDKLGVLLSILEGPFTSRTSPVCPKFHTWSLFTDNGGVPGGRLLLFSPI
jgi:hypothetical protein